MKVKGQTKEGQLIIDGEGEEVHLAIPISMELPVVLTNFTFSGDVLNYGSPPDGTPCLMIFGGDEVWA